MTRLTPEERAAIDRFLAEREKANPKGPRRVIRRKVREYPDRILPRVQSRNERLKPQRKPKPQLVNISVRDALHWTFATQAAQLELPDNRDYGDRGYGFGMEYIMIERAKLGGVQIDGGSGPDQTHEDAEAVAAIVANLPLDLGGIRMATIFAECGRTNSVPDYMPDAMPRLTPNEWRKNSHGEKIAKSEFYQNFVEFYDMPHPRNKAKWIQRRKTFEGRITRCHWAPSAETIRSKREFYGEWWSALNHIRVSLTECKMLRELSLSNAMPPRRPWATSDQPETAPACS